MLFCHMSSGGLRNIKKIGIWDFHLWITKIESEYKNNNLTPRYRWPRFAQNDTFDLEYHVTQWHWEKNNKNFEILFFKQNKTALALFFEKIGLSNSYFFFP